MLDLEWLDSTPMQTPPNAQKGAVAPQTGKNVYVSLDRDKKAREMALEAYIGYQHNIIASEALRAEILKGLAKGESHTVILEKAIRCIGLMTHDKVFAQQAASML